MITTYESPFDDSEGTDIEAENLRILDEASHRIIAGWNPDVLDSAAQVPPPESIDMPDPGESVGVAFRTVPVALGRITLPPETHG